MTTITAARPLSERTPTSPMYGFRPIVLKQLVIAMTNPWTVIFTIGLPTMIYLIFGASGVGEQALPHGNLAGLILISLGQYAAVMAIAMLTAEIAIERVKGWTRTVALTPLGMRAYMFSKVTVSVLVGILVLSVIFAIGHFTGAAMAGPVWLQSFLLIVALSVVPALLGLVVAAIVGGEQAYGIIGGGSAVLGFLSGMFVPLDQLNSFFQTFAKFTPLWGMNQIALGPITGWEGFETLAIVNIAAWIAILIGSAVLLSKKLTSR